MIAGCIQNLPSECSDTRSRGSEKNNILDFCKTAEVEKQNLWVGHNNNTLANFIY